MVYRFQTIQFIFILNCVFQYILTDFTDLHCISTVSNCFRFDVCAIIQDDEKLFLKKKRDNGEFGNLEDIV